MKVIDADALAPALDKITDIYIRAKTVTPKEIEDGLKPLLVQIMQAKEAEPVKVPNKTGHWRLRKCGTPYCSECGAEQQATVGGARTGRSYCSNCGSCNTLLAY